MGARATGVNGQVLLQLATENPDEVHGRLPGGELFNGLMALLYIWLGSHLGVRLQFCVVRHLLPDVQLCCRQAHVVQLGYITVLRPLDAQKQADGRITIYLEHYQRVRESIIHRGESDEDGDYRR